MASPVSPPSPPPPNKLLNIITTDSRITEITQLLLDPPRVPTHDEPIEEDQEDPTPAPSLEESAEWVSVEPQEHIPEVVASTIEVEAVAVNGHASEDSLTPAPVQVCGQL